MKVLVVHNAYQSHHVGGEDVVFVRELAALKATLGDHNVLEYRVYNDDIRPLKLAFTIWGDKHHSDAIAKMVKENQIDIVHVHNFFPLLTPRIFVGAKKAGAKIVHTLHNYRWWCLSGILYREGNGICEKCVNKSFGWPAVYHGCYRHSRAQSFMGSLAFAFYRLKRYADLIDKYFVLTQMQKEKLKPLLPESKMVVKPNLINKPNNFIAFQEKKNYLFVGRLEESKGFNLLLSSWQQLPQSFQLDVIGTDTHEHYAKTVKLPNIRFLGKLSHQETLEHMAKAKYVLQPSLWYETFGLTIVEAMAEGTPVIGFNIGTRPELIQSAFNGFITSEEKFIETLYYADAYQDYETLCQNARESAKAYFPEAIMAKQTQYYQEVLNG